MTRDEFVRCLYPLEVVSGSPVSVEQAKVYYAVLGHLEPAMLETAVARHLRMSTERFLPAPGLLLQYADEAAHGIEMTADQAVDLVWKAVRKHGTFSTDDIRAAQDELGPKITAAMKAAGGYMRFADCSSGDKGTLIAQFREAWNANVRREEQQRRLPAALVPRMNGPEVHRLESTPATPRLVAHGANS